MLQTQSPLPQAEGSRGQGQKIPRKPFLLSVIALLLIAAVTVPAFLSSPQRDASAHHTTHHKKKRQKDQKDQKQQQQQQANVNCTLLVPNAPLTAQGLATPYQLSATNADNGPCNEANAKQSAFVQAVIYDPATGQLSQYDPLVIDKGSQPALTPTAPTVPAGAVVGIWFGFNATNLTLRGAEATTIAQANCVNGLNQGGEISVFGQFAYCNAQAFFAAVTQGIAQGRVVVPAVGTGSDGQMCLTTRAWGLIDQDQSDNVQTRYLANTKGQTAQFSAANLTQVQNPITIANPSDNALLTRFVDPALGCQAREWQIPDQTNNNTLAPSLPTDELQAAANPQPGQTPALVPLNDPMTLVNQTQSVDKTMLYRAGVDQPTGAPADGTTYCWNFVTFGLPRIQQDQPLTIMANTPDAAMANNLFTFLAQRAKASYVNLGCQPLLRGMPNPVTVQVDGNGVAVAATINLMGPTASITPTVCPTTGTNTGATPAVPTATSCPTATATPATTVPSAMGSPSPVNTAFPTGTPCSSPKANEGCEDTTQ